MRAIDLTGQKFGRLTVLKKADTYVYPSGKTRIRWLCKCECGNTFIAKGNELKNGHTKSCGCLNQELRSERKFKDLTFMRFGTLVPLFRVGTKTKTHCSSTPLWYCVCLNCGSEIVVRSDYLQNKDVISCGCVISRGEYEVRRYLNSHGIKYRTQYSFPDLLSPKGNPLRFDFAIFDDEDNLKFLIEYQGEQHRYNLSFGEQTRTVTDPMKKEYCKKNSIILHEIWFDEDIEERLNEIFSHANPVPSIA